MTFTYTDELLSYMEEKKKNIIVFELVIADNSEFEVTELHVHLIDEARAEDFKYKKGYGTVKTEHGEILLPRFKFRIKDPVVLGLKKFLFFKSISYDGFQLEK